MKSHRFWTSLLLFVVIVGARNNAAAQTPPDNPPAGAGVTQTVDRQLPPEQPHPFWTERRVNLVAGFGSATAAGVVAFLKERDLRVRKSQLQSLPAGSNDEWARQYAEAERVLKDRNFWGGVAAGVGGVTLVYMFASRSHLIRPLPGGAALVWSF